MPTQYAPIESTLSNDVVRNTRQPGQPGRPRTAAQDEEHSSRRAVPKLFEIATDPANLEAYAAPVYSQDPSYLFGVELDEAMNNVDEWAISFSARRSIARSMRSWQRLFMYAGVSDPITDEEWNEVVGARNIPKPPGITRSGAEWYVRMYDADLVAEKMRRNGRNPFLQTLVGSFAGGFIDPTNIAVNLASSAVSVAALPFVAPAVASAGIGLPIIAALRYGPSFLRNVVAKPYAVAATRIISEAAAAVPLELDVAEFYGEEYGVKDFLTEVAAALVLHGTVSKVIEKYQSSRKSLHTNTVTAADAKAHAIVDGTSDADIITSDAVAKHMEPLDEIYDIPADSGTAPKIKPPFDPEMRARFEEGPRLEAERIEGAKDKVAAFRAELERRAAADSDAGVIWRKAQKAAEDVGLVLEGDGTSPHVKDAMRIALADRAEGMQGRLAPIVTAALKRYIKKLPKGVATRGTRLIDTVRKNNLTAPQVRQIAEELIQHLGVSQRDARAMVLTLSRDEALSWIDSIMTAARGTKIPEGAAPLRVVASVLEDTPPRIQGERVVQNVHNALWLAASRTPRAINAVVRWLEDMGMPVSDRAYFEHALVEAGERYRADYGSGARLNPLEYLEDAINREPVVEPRRTPVERAESTAASRIKGEPVAPSDVVPIKELVGSEDVATPAATSAIRAEVDDIIQTGKIGDMVIDDANRSALADLVAGIDRLTEALRVCVRK